MYAMPPLLLSFYVFCVLATALIHVCVVCGM